MRITSKKVYAFLITFLPMLAVYISPIPGMDLGTFVVLFYGVYCFFRKPRFWNSPSFLVLILYTLLITVLNLISATKMYSDTFTVVMRVMRFVIMLIIMIEMGYSNDGDETELFQYLRFFSVFVAVYAILQLLFFQITGLKLINVFGSTKQGVQFNSELGKYEAAYRPPSVFLEPSSVTYYIIPYICMALFLDFDSKKEKQRNFFYALIITFGVICTTSGQGVIALAVIWALWLLKELFRGHFGKIFIIVSIVAGVIWLTSGSILEFTFGRITETEGLSAVEAREIGYKTLKDLDTFHMFFGNGYGNYIESIYYSSIADILFCTGYVGLVLVGIFYISIFFRKSLCQKVMVIATVILMLYGGVYTATYLCLYIPFLVMNVKNISLRKEKQIWIS